MGHCAPLHPTLLHSTLATGVRLLGMNSLAPRACAMSDSGCELWRPDRHFVPICIQLGISSPSACGMYVGTGWTRHFHRIYIGGLTVGRGWPSSMIAAGSPSLASLVLVDILSYI